MTISESKKKPEIDWVHLPADTQPKDLWDCLHDAELWNVLSDLLNRSVMMTFDVFYIREYHKLPDGTLFNFIFDGVTSVRVNTYAVWPGKFAVPKGASRDEEHRLIAEYQSKWREESLDWNDFEKFLQNKKSLLSVSDSELASNNHSVSIKIGGFLNDKYHKIFIQASKLTIEQSDGKLLNLDKFIMLGREYWHAFSEGKLKN